MRRRHKDGRRPRYASHPERLLQASLVEFFACAVPAGHAVLFAVPNGEERDPVTAGILTGLSSKRRELLPDELYLTPYGQGVIPGPLDLVLVTSGAVTFVEVKIPGGTVEIAGELVKRRPGKLTRGQRLFMAAVGRLGHESRQVTNLEEWAALLREKGLTVRTSGHA